MKVILLTTLCAVFTCSFSFGQSDTTLVYYNKDGRETTKDSAFARMQFYKQGNMWHGKEYFTKTGIVKSEGNYAEKNVTTPVGDFDNFSEDGKLDFKASYNNGKLLERTYYHKNGAKKSKITLTDKGIQSQKGWDKDGKEIPGYVVFREARFKGGAEGWQKYLEKHLNSSVAVEAGAPAGDYTVMVEFSVSKEGYVRNVKAITVPAKCKPCATEAVSVILSGPEWEPAIQNNEPVIYRQRQMVTFQVSEEKKGKKN